MLSFEDWFSIEDISVACGTRKDYWRGWGGGGGAHFFGFCNSLIFLEVLHKQVMVTTIHIIPMLHFGQDCVPGMWNLMSDMDFYVYMNHPTSTVTYMNNKFGFFQGTSTK